MKIEIWSDFVCPFCYIGKRKLEKALENFKYKDKVEVVFKSYELNPDAPEVPDGEGYAAFAKVKGVSEKRAKEMMDPLTDFAKTYGLDYQMDKTKMMKTVKAHRLAKWARTKNKENELSELLMDAYFTKGANLADNDTLLALVEKVGLSKEEALSVLNSEEYLGVVQQEIYEARLIGVQGVPFFVFNDKYAIAGAQDDALFVQTLEKVFKESSPITLVNTATTATGGICDPDEGCN